MTTRVNTFTTAQLVPETNIVVPADTSITICSINMVWNRTWEEELRGMNFFPKEEVLEFGLNYPSTERPDSEEKLLLVEYTGYVHPDPYLHARVWAKEVGLEPTSPREIIAVARQCPDIIRRIREMENGYLYHTDAKLGESPLLHVYWCEDREPIVLKQRVGVFPTQKVEYYVFRLPK